MSEGRRLVPLAAHAAPRRTQRRRVDRASSAAPVRLGTNGEARREQRPAQMAMPEDDLQRDRGPSSARTMRAPNTAARSSARASDAAWTGRSPSDAAGRSVGQRAQRLGGASPRTSQSREGDRGPDDDRRPARDRSGRRPREGARFEPAFARCPLDRRRVAVLGGPREPPDPPAVDEERGCSAGADPAATSATAAEASAKRDRPEGRFVRPTSRAYRARRPAERL